MNNQKQKGISSLLGIIIVIVVGVLVIGGVLVYQYLKTPGEEVKLPEEVNPSEEGVKSLGIEAPEEKVPEEKIAEKTLVDFFTYLHDKEYDKAAPLYAWEDADDPGRYLLGPYTRAFGDKEKALEDFCRANFTCFKIRVIKTEKLSDAEYKFTIQFLMDNGEIFSYGPCCGGEGDPETEFKYKVEKIEDKYKVMTPPLFVP